MLFNLNKMSLYKSRICETTLLKYCWNQIKIRNKY